LFTKKPDTGGISRYRGLQCSRRHLGRNFKRCGRGLAAAFIEHDDRRRKAAGAKLYQEVWVDDNFFVTLVSANVNPKKKDRSVKKTLTLPQWLNERAEKQGINFSQTLQEALLHKII